MKKTIKLLVFTMLLTSVFCCTASASSGEEKVPVPEENAEYTENGDNEGISPHIVVSNKVSKMIEYSGELTSVPETYPYSAYDPVYKTVMSGTLYKQKVVIDSERKVTQVYYYGTVTGTV